VAGFLVPVVSTALMTQTPENQPLQHTTVFIIDDDPVYRTLLRDVCASLGVSRILEATNGPQALAAMEKIIPDLVLLDIMMPEMDGLEVCRRLRARPELAETAILIQSGLTDDHKRLKGYEAGATDYVTKPLQRDEFRARVSVQLRNAVNRRRLVEFHDRIEGHLNTAQQLLTALLPDLAVAKETARRNGFALSVQQRQHEEIGGDLWYLHELAPGKILVILLDPNVPGLAGAMNALRVDTVLRELWRSMRDPQHLLRALDRAMAESPCGRLFASVTAIVLDQTAGLMWYTASGNPYPIFCRDQHATTLISGGLPLGSGLAALELNHLSIKTGDSLVLHSDGWPPQNEHPVELLQTVLQSGRPLEAESLPIAQSQLYDDATIITLRRL
jgi:phosphoserine phosphatase RsbU/P